MGETCDPWDSGEEPAGVDTSKAVREDRGIEEIRPLTFACVAPVGVLGSEETECVVCGIRVGVSWTED